MGKNLFGKSTHEEWINKLRLLVNKAGSQKKYAESIGISDRTVRRWLSGQTIPQKNYITRVNRAYGQLQRYESPKESRKRLTKTVSFMPIESWLYKYYSEYDYLFQQLLGYARDKNKAFAAYSPDMPEVSEWLTENEYFEMKVGKPAYSKEATLIGTILRYPRYTLEDAHKFRYTLLNAGYREDWNLDHTLLHMHNVYMDGAYTGKDGQQYHANAALPAKFISYFL